MKTKHIIIIVAVMTLAGGLFGCNHAGKDDPGSTFMPDMYYSRAFDAYSDNPNFADGMSSRLPVPGTIKRGEMLPYHLDMSDSSYAYSGLYRNPLQPTDSLLGAGKHLFNIYCAICHGGKLDGNGPLYAGGAGPFTSAPANFMTGPKSSLPEGTMFYVATYGKNMMGSYSSQLDRGQRWAVVSYIHSMQRQNGSTQAKEDSTQTTLTKAYSDSKAFLAKTTAKQ
jgi:mono/diheme cytochrome c family protein